MRWAVSACALWACACLVLSFPAGNAADTRLLRFHADMSALFGRQGGIRSFASQFCGTNHTVSSLRHVQAAHAVEWNIMGKEAPWWSVLTLVSPRTRDISRQDKAVFYRTGERHAAEVAGTLGLRARGGGAALSVLDFGCGLGRLAFAFARMPGVGHVTCADQSVHHLRIAAAEWRERRPPDGEGRLDFVLTGVDLLGALRGRRYDVVHSVIVLQHMVAPLQGAYLEQLCDALAPGGVGWLQIPVTDGFGATPEAREGFAAGFAAPPCNLEQSITQGGMQMHFTPAEEVLRVVRAAGCSVTAVDVGPKHTGPGSGFKSVELLLRRPGPGDGPEEGRAR